MTELNIERMSQVARFFLTSPSPHALTESDLSAFFCALGSLLPRYSLVFIAFHQPPSSGLALPLKLLAFS